MSVSLATGTADREEIVRLLRDEGYRITQPRIAIVDAVLAAPGQDLILETEALQVRAVVADVAYGSGGTPQSFFGKLTIDGEVYVLNDVYYVNQPDPATPGQLVKRGNEVHGPRDPMLINVQQVLQVENLRDDSQVAQGIRLIQSGQAPPLATPAPTTPRPSPTR